MPKATKVTTVEDCARVAERGLKPPFESPHANLLFLAFLDFLAFFLFKEFLAILSVFPFFPKDLRGSASIGNPRFFGGFPCRFPKRQGKEDQGPPFALSPKEAVLGRILLCGHPVKNFVGQSASAKKRGWARKGSPESVLTLSSKLSDFESERPYDSYGGNTNPTSSPSSVETWDGPIRMNHSPTVARIA